MLFIFGCSRTASKAYMHLFNKHTHYNITRELHLHKKRGANSINGKLHLFNQEHGSTQKLANDLAKLYNASYWKSEDFEAHGFSNFLSEKNVKKLDYSTIVKLILEYDKLRQEKRFCGAKFPIHIAFFPIFKKWYPSGQYIFLCREPSSIAYSQFNKHELNRTKKRVSMLLYTSIMFNFTVLWGYLWKSQNSIFIPYETFKNQQKAVITELCKFLKLEFNNEMLSLPVLGSRMQENKASYELKLWEKVLIKVFTFPFGYIYKRRTFKLTEQ